MRIDAYLAEHYPEYSRSTWQKYIKRGDVSVNDETVTSPKHNLSEDDHVTYELSDVAPKKIDVAIIYEDENVLVIDKPAGILSHSKGALNSEATIASWLYPRLAEDWRLETGDDHANRLGIVHRLDRDTSGVMILAKNDATASMLQKQFANRLVKKSYLAVIKGTMRHPEANIELPIERNPKLPSQFRVGAGGKPAATHYKVIKQASGYSLLELSPQTGRTHQLRVHLAYLKTPIVGDRVYGKAADRLYLHAAKLELTIPDGKRKVFSSPLPREFNDIMESK